MINHRVYIGIGGVSEEVLLEIDAAADITADGNTLYHVIGTW